MSNTVRDLFDLPAQVRKGDFVLKLAEGVERPQETADTYVVTPALRDAFDRALGLVGSALRDGRSQASYLHGSFGSGKSHFMALLSLLLDGREEAWRLPELHELRTRHAFAGRERILQLRLHMIGQESLEAAIFGRYVAEIRARHPEAPVPGLFADEKLFSDARKMLDELEDAAFFAPMNEGQKREEGWGDFDQPETWDRARFDACASAIDPKEREELFSALVKTRFSAFADESRAYVDLDAGLGLLSRHAAALGYRAVVLFLDEIILWLAARASEGAWLHAQAQKMVKLVEAEDAKRTVPIVSFMARQRNLADMVGEEYAGAENARLNESLKHWEGRYGKIEIEGRNLPAIVERRVLRPKDGGARRTLEEAFDRLRRTAGASWTTLLGHEDAEAFRRLYPFSPALVEALVALSSSLQRERTAIKLLVEILVEHIPDLKLGELVGVGDLFDVLAGGEDTADGAMRSHFESAKQLYRYQLLPLIQEANGTNTEERCPRLRADHPARLGCSGCTEKACRTDNRLIKTLLIAALVPETMRELTASRLVQLNHGTLKVPVAGTEASLATQKLRHWATSIGQIHVGAQADPSVRIQLEGVDLRPILDMAREHDTTGARQRVVRDLLFNAMGVDTLAGFDRDHTIEWRETKRLGRIHFGNVRRMPPEQLRCAERHDWTMVVDYPFDDPGYGPRHDLEVVERLKAESGGTWTLVWLPSFFSASMNRMLGELVILEHILESTETKRRYVSHLTVENQGRTVLDLENLRSQKKARILKALANAYGVGTRDEADLDATLSVEQHTHVLKPGAQVQASLAANLDDAVEHYMRALLEIRYPRHPHFTRPLTKATVEKVTELFGQVIDSEDKRVSADPDVARLAAGTLGELGLVRTTETAVHLLDDRTLQQIEKKRQQQAVDTPTVADVRRWNDEAGKQGLQPEAWGLVVRCYARWAARTLVRDGRPFEVRPGQPLPDDVVLERPDLPSQTDWVAALALAGHAFGVALPGKALHADNLKRFEALVADRLRASAGACARVPGLLADRLAAFGQPANADRARTAASANALCAALAGKRGADQVRALAAFVAETSARAVGQSIAAAVDSAAVLGDVLVFGTFEQLRARAADLAGAEEIAGQVAVALRQDEIHVALAPRLRQLAEEGARILAPKEPPGEEVLLKRRIDARGKAAIREDLERAVQEVRTALDSSDESVHAVVSIELRSSRK